MLFAPNAWSICVNLPSNLPKISPKVCIKKLHVDFMLFAPNAWSICVNLPKISPKVSIKNPECREAKKMIRKNETSILFDRKKKKKTIGEARPPKSQFPASGVLCAVAVEPGG